MLWWNVRDDPRDRGYQFGLQSGVYLRGPTVAADTPKPLLTAFRFPFTAQRAGRGRSTTEVWGLAPAAGEVLIQRQSGTVWATVARLTAGPDRLVRGRIRFASGSLLRAVQDGEASITAPAP
jgi:hypothetical protein